MKPSGTLKRQARRCAICARGDRVVVPSTVGCGTCVYCRGGYHSQCNIANPNGPDAGTVFFGGPEEAGGLDGLQAEAFQRGSAPSQALKWAIESVAKAGTVSVIGVYPTPLQDFPIKKIMEKNLTIRAGNLQSSPLHA
jgi:threonine dehydrogenase-like Zn-dependent dehydrogenase